MSSNFIGQGAYGCIYNPPLTCEELNKEYGNKNYEY
jgi:hypothetical protein